MRREADEFWWKFILRDSTFHKLIANQVEGTAPFFLFLGFNHRGVPAFLVLSQFFSLFTRSFCNLLVKPFSGVLFQNNL